MPVMEGTVTIVQEGRFQIIDDDGGGHLFVLGPKAQAETSQLQPLARSQKRVRVTYEDVALLIAMQARRVEVI